MTINEAILRIIAHIKSDTRKTDSHLKIIEALNLAVDILEQQNNKKRPFVKAGANEILFEIVNCFNTKNCPPDELYKAIKRADDFIKEQIK